MGVFLHLLEVQPGFLARQEQIDFEVCGGRAYSLLGKKLFGNGIKYPLLRFAGVPDRLLRRHLYLNFTGYKRNPKGMDEFPAEIVPAFQSVREKGLNMIDASI